MKSGVCDFKMPRRWGKEYYVSGDVPEYNYWMCKPKPPKIPEKLSLIFAKSKVAISDK